jgi:hypothetical protein
LPTKKGSYATMTQDYERPSTTTPFRRAGYTGGRGHRSLHAATPTPGPSSAPRPSAKRSTSSRINYATTSTPRCTKVSLAAHASPLSRNPKVGFYETFRSVCRCTPMGQGPLRRLPSEIGILRSPSNLALHRPRCSTQSAVKS